MQKYNSMFQITEKIKLYVLIHTISEHSEVLRSWSDKLFLFIKQNITEILHRKF